MSTIITRTCRSLTLAAVAAMLTTGSALSGPTLKSVVRIAGGIVTVGDLIDDAGPFATLPLYRSPDLGTTGTVPTSDIVARIRSLGLTGVQTGGLSDIVVSRIATDVTAADLAKQVAAAIAPRLDAAAGQIEVSFDQTPAVAKADSTSRQPARIVDLNLQSASGRFDAVVEIDKGGPVERLRLRGQAVEMVDVLMLTRPLQRGDVVLASDLVPQRLPRAQADRLGQTDPTVLIGKEAKRQLRANTPALAADFGAARIIAKGDVVTILVDMPGLMLTVRGVAQEPGTLGDQIAVMNEQSRRVIHGEVSGPGRIVVRRSAAPAAALARLERPAQ